MLSFNYKQIIFKTRLFYLISVLSLDSKDIKFCTKPQSSLALVVVLFVPYFLNYYRILKLTILLVW